MILCRWILTPSVLATAAVVGLTIESPPATDALTSEQWRERAAEYFPGWHAMFARAQDGHGQGEADP